MGEIKRDERSKINHSLKFISGLVIAYPMFNLLVWLIALITLYLTANFIPIASDIYGIIAFFIIPFVICIYLAKGLMKYEKLARILVILFSLIIFLNNIPIWGEAPNLKFGFPTLLSIIPAILRIIASAFIGLYLLFNKKVKKDFN